MVGLRVMPSLPDLTAEQRAEIRQACGFACVRCGSHSLRGHRWLAVHARVDTAAPVERRNIHDHPEAGADEVDAFLEAKLREPPLGMYAMEQLTQDAMMAAHAARVAKTDGEAKPLAGA